VTGRACRAGAVVAALAFGLAGAGGGAEAGGGLAAETAASFLGFLSAPQRDALLAKGSLTDAGRGLDELALWRGAPFETALKAAVAGRTCTLAAESWSVLDLPPAADADSLNLAVFKAFTAFSSMKGLRTRSAIFDGTEPFMVDSRRVAAAGDMARLPDPSDARAPDRATYVLYGKEALVGEVWYELRFASSEAWSEISLTNLTPVKSLLMTLVKPRELLTLFFVAPTSDRLLLYGLTLAQTPVVPGAVGIERRSLANRMMALAAWFKGNLGGR
jgi:hypothetical protein